LQLHCLATSFYIFIVFFNAKGNEKIPSSNDFCSLKNALSNGVLEVKISLDFYAKILLFLNETRKLGRSHCLTVLSW
jgi:hypothetical protein